MGEKTQKEEAKKEGTYSSLLLLNEIRRLQESQKKTERNRKISNFMTIAVLMGIIAFLDIPIFYKTLLITNAYFILEDFREGLRIIFSNLKSFFIKKRN